ncbi:MAG: hypothetical protein RSC01_08955 [Oscillospiraceae bacterium]
MKTFLKAALSFVLSLLLLMLIVSALISSTVLNVDFMISQQEKNNYYADVANSFVKRATPYFTSNGLLPGMLASYVDENEIGQLIQANTNAFYSGKNGRIDGNIVFASLSDEICKGIAENDVKITDDIKSSVDQISLQVQNLYAGYLVMPMEDVLSTMKKLYSYTYSPFLIASMLVIAAVSVLALFRLCKNKREFNDYIVISLFSIGLSCIAVPLYWLLSNSANNIMNNTMIYYKLFVSIANSVLSSLVLIGAILIIVVIAIRLISLFKNANKKKQQNKNYYSLDANGNLINVTNS